MKCRKGVAADMSMEQINQTGTEGTSGLAGLRILMAEDNEINWRILSELLKSSGISSHWAKNGRECVEMLSRVPAGTFSLVLMDIQMPEMDGLEATKAIRADPHISDIPIVAMTADTMFEDVAACEAAGMDGHIPKPVDLEIVLREIQRVLDKRGQ